MITAVKNNARRRIKADTQAVGGQTYNLSDLAAGGLVPLTVAPATLPPSSAGHNRTISFLVTGLIFHNVGTDETNSVPDFVFSFRSGQVSNEDERSYSLWFMLPDIVSGQPITKIKFEIHDFNNDPVTTKTITGLSLGNYVINSDFKTNAGNVSLELIETIDQLNTSGAQGAAVSVDPPVFTTNIPIYESYADEWVSPDTIQGNPAQKYFIGIYNSRISRFMGGVLAETISIPKFQTIITWNASVDTLFFGLYFNYDEDGLCSLTLRIAGGGQVIQTLKEFTIPVAMFNTEGELDFNFILFGRAVEPF